MFGYKSADGDYTGSPVSATQEAFYESHGFYIYNGGADYVLRPEVLESNFYAWRATGDDKYFDRARQALASFDKFLKIPSADQQQGLYSGILDVDQAVVTNAERVDDTESFWFAETLKYLWVGLFLTFAPALILCTKGSSRSMIPRTSAWTIVSCRKFSHSQLHVYYYPSSL